MSNLRSTEIETNDDGYVVRHCGICGASIIWSETLYGEKRIPLDAVANPQGNVAVEDRGYGRLIAQTFSGQNLEAVRRRGTPTLYMSHVATCPDVRK